MTSARWAKVTRSLSAEEIDEAIGVGLLRIELTAKLLPKPARNQSVRFASDRAGNLFSCSGDETVAAAAGFLQSIWPLSIHQLNLKHLLDLAQAQMKDLGAHGFLEIVREPEVGVASSEPASPFAEHRLDAGDVADFAFFAQPKLPQRATVTTASSDLRGAINIAYSYALRAHDTSRPVLIIVPDHFHLRAVMLRLLPIEPSVFVHADGLTRAEESALAESLAAGETTTVIGRRSAIHLAARMHFDRIIILDAGSELMRSPEAPRLSAVDLALILSGLLGVKVLLHFYTPHPLAQTAGAHRASAVRWQLIVATEEEPKTSEVEPPVLPEDSKSTGLSHIIDQLSLIAARHAPLLVMEQALGTTSGVFCALCFSPIACPECGRAIHRRSSAGVYLCPTCGFGSESIACAECGGTEVSFRRWGVESVFGALKERMGGAVGWLSTETPSAELATLSRRSIVVSTTLALTHHWDFAPEAIAFVRPETHWTGVAFRGPFARLEFLLRPLARFQSIESTYIITDWGDHPVFAALAAGNLRDFLADEMELRRKFKLLPFAERVEVTVRAKKAAVVREIRDSLVEAMRVDGALVLAGGPVRLRAVRRGNVELKVAATYKEGAPVLLRDAIRAARERAEVVPDVFYF